MHANYPSIVGLGAPETQTWATLTFDDLLGQERAAFEAFRRNMRVPRTRAHLVEGNPAKQIPRLAHALGADLVVMGALSRSGLQRVFIGNTAERVLGALKCDVLVVKPEKFGLRIAAEPRGIRVQAPATPVLTA